MIEHIDRNTGEILSETKEAEYNGLTFIIKQSTVNGRNPVMLVCGSLAKFYNKGLDNAFDFDVTMLAQTINTLQNTFGINPHLAILQKLEVGVNLHTQIHPNQIIRGLITHKDKTFGIEKRKGFFGYKIERQSNEIKIYNKGLQAGIYNTNIFRIEKVLKFNKSLSPYGITTLADLLDIDKLNNLKPLLCEMWESVIFFDSGYKNSNLRATKKLMKQKDKEFFLEHRTPNTWANYHKEQRRYAKEKFNKLRKEYDTSTLHTDILKALHEKLNELTTIKQPKPLPNKEMLFKNSHLLQHLVFFNLQSTRADTAVLMPHKPP
ncbi:MAG: hypothetical protein KF900_07900 [Bacteroidetes bacterium]|nr:hypothetical protein [Bacteroidota bacterium]